DQVVVYLRLVEDIAVPQARAGVLPVLRPMPEQDVVFARYAEHALKTIQEPTPDELAIRLRRLYPHAQVVADGQTWLGHRDRRAGGLAPPGWWEDPSLPRVRCDQQGLILDANDAALRLINRGLVGRHWHEFVIAGSTAEVDPVIETIRDAGWGLSRFRMP